MKIRLRIYRTDPAPEYLETREFEAPEGDWDYLLAQVKDYTAGKYGAGEYVFCSDFAGREILQT